VSHRLAESALDPATPRDRLIDTAPWLGDVLVTFGAAGPPPARRPDTPFAPLCAGASWRVWASLPSGAWHGAPVMRLAADGWCGWLLGELYATTRPAADALAVLTGQASPNQLNGHFLLLGHHAPADEWHVWTNRHASFHAYYAGDGRRAALGTCFRATAGAAARPDLDWEGLTTFFGFGFCAADRTFLADVRVLRPATHYRFDARGCLLSAERYWSWQRNVDATRSPAATLAEYTERFQAVMNDLLRDGCVAVPISGGLDSRSTVAAIDPAGPAVSRLWAYSYGYQPDSIETRLAAQIAAARGLSFKAFTIPPYLFDALPRVLSSIEGFQEVTMARQASVVDAIARHSDYLIAAHWGDVYHDAMGVAESTSPAALPAVAYHKFLKQGSAWLLRHVSAPRLGGTPPEEMLRAVIATELDRLGPLDEPDFSIKALKVDQYGPRLVSASLRMFQAAAFPRLPFYDARLVDFFCTVPTGDVAGRRLQIAHLQRHAPDLARVPWQETGRDLFGAPRFNPLRLPRRVARKARTVLGGPRLIERNWEVQFLGDGGRRGLAEWLLRPGRRLHDVVAVDAIRDLLAAFTRDPWGEQRGSEAKPAYTVSLLLTLSAWLDYMAGELDE
jgi:hypothetical protein